MFSDRIDLIKTRSLAAEQSVKPSLMHTAQVGGHRHSSVQPVVKLEKRFRFLTVDIGVCVFRLTGGYPAPCYTPDGRL